jgi:hypothetical protein
MFRNLPKLSKESSDKIKEDITENELKEALKTCNESAPGPDGLTYGIYKKLWGIFGEMIHKSWKFSTDVGKLAPSQRDSVINLLEKKGKDKERIENLRPISLSNCDIKICTKALAIRTNKVLKEILITTQTGYIPGTQVNDNSRLLEEIIEFMEKTKQDGYLITLDAQKAFDSVDHNYLQKILGMYGFPPEYISWIKTIYKDLRANVLVNGYKTQVFNIERSVKQGDALSCALFIIAIDPLLKAIDKDTRIKPIKIEITEGQNLEIKSATFADDITALCTNREGINYIIEQYTNFSMYSGITLNIPKTEIMRLGKTSESVENFTIKNGDAKHTITESKSVKICGITFSMDKDLAYNENIIKKIDKLQKQLNIWRQRNLTLHGKVLIVKTFGLSQLQYSLQTCTINKKEINEIEDIIYRFIWNTKPSSLKITHKIKKRIMQSDKSTGGLKVTNIAEMDQAIKYKHLLRSMTNDHPVAVWLRKILEKSNVFLNTNCKPKLDNISDYHKKAIECHLNILKKVNEDIDKLSNESDDIKIHSQYFAYISNQLIENSIFTNRNQNHMIKKLKEKGINTYYKLYREKRLKENPQLWYEVMQLMSTFPKTWEKLLNRSRKYHNQIDLMIPIKENIWKVSNQITLNEIKKRISNIKEMTEKDVIGLINNKHNISNIENTINKTNPFKTLYNTTKEVKLINVQFKILHNIYPTMKHLHKWGIKDTSKCNACNIDETTGHAIYDCPIAKEALVKLRTKINTDMGHNLTLSKEDVLYGIDSISHPMIPRKDAATINTILIILKRKLILQRETKIMITNDELTHMINSQARLEEYIRKKSLRHEQKGG